MHGGGGHSVATSLQAMDAAVAFHRARGTTATLVSLMTAPVDELREQLAWAAELTRRGPRPSGNVLGPISRGRFSRPAAAAPRMKRTSSRLTGRSSTS
jgi:N-acetylglucosamine-6-phosphate deacetylase